MVPYQLDYCCYHDNDAEKVGMKLLPCQSFLQEAWGNGRLVEVLGRYCEAPSLVGGMALFIATHSSYYC